MGRERALRGREFAAGELKKAQKGAKKRDPEQFRLAVEFLAEQLEDWENRVKEGERELKRVELEIVSRCRGVP